MVLSWGFFLGTLPRPGRHSGVVRQDRTRNLEVPGSMLSHRPGTTAFATYSSFPIATAVSAMRLEKPHSLSYQLITRTKLPFWTLVWSMWKVDECGSWLKSIETLGAVV